MQYSHLKYNVQVTVCWFLPLPRVVGVVLYEARLPKNNVKAYFSKLELKYLVLAEM